MQSDYQIIIIIILIITSIISLALYVALVYIPSSRAADQVDILSTQGTEVIDMINNEIDTIKDNTITLVNGICEGFCTGACTYNSRLVTCPLSQEAIPSFCDPITYNINDPNCCCGRLCD